MNTLKMMMGGGTDIAQLAEMIRQMGRGDDKILAHITPEEAAMLKEQGGSGTINPMTGLPEFQEMYPREEILRAEANMPGQDYYGYMEPATQIVQQPTVTYNQPSIDYPQPSFEPPDALYEMQMADQEAAAPSPVGGRQVAPVEDNIFKRAERGLQDLRGTLDRDYPTLTRIGGAGANLIAQALMARRANRAREAEAGRLRERAQPFRAAEQEALSRVRGEGLSPIQARQMEIEMAQARQGLSNANRATGSAAAGILSTQMQRARSRARQESLQSALDLAQIADRYERQAIQEELAKDKELADLFASVVAKEIEASSRTQAPQGRG